MTNLERRDFTKESKSPYFKSVTMPNPNCKSGTCTAELNILAGKWHTWLDPHWICPKCHSQYDLKDFPEYAEEMLNK